MFTGMQCADRNGAWLLRVSLEEKSVLIQLCGIYNKKQSMGKLGKLTTLNAN